MIWRIEIKDKDGVFDAMGNSVLRDIADLGVSAATDVRVVQVFLVEGDLDAKAADCIARELLVDGVVQEYRLADKPFKDVFAGARDSHVVEIAYNIGVMDPVEASTIKGIRDLGITGAKAVRTSRQYVIEGHLTDKQLEIIKDKALMNKLVQHAVKDPAAAFKPVVLDGRDKAKTEAVAVPLKGLSVGQLEALSKKGQLYLNVNEMKTIQAHFEKAGRSPTDIELETIAQTWSEHCHHKTFRGNISYTVKEKGRTKTELINNLLKNTIVKATTTLNKSWCVSVFHDNAGVVKFDDKYDICFKAETHNHPSALEPFGGSNTGVGGVIRDILGTGLGAKPVCNTDVFCFAPPDFAADKLPAGALHPKRVMKGVVSGVRDYGNKMGIPTINGALCFHDHYVGNPLVFCGTIGLLPKGMDKKTALKGDLIVVAGGRTGRDGIHGATFSSGELTHESEVVSSGAVQIGNPIEEKKVLDVLVQARDEGLYSYVTDCGAGGLSSAIGEMGETLGARVDLDKVPLKYQGLNYTEIWISESQERMVFAVPPSKIKRMQEIFAAENVELAVLGTYPGTGRLELFHHGVQVCDLDMAFMHGGIPKIAKKATWAAPKHKEPKFKCPADLSHKLREVLSDYNVCSKEAIIRRYDHEVQGGSVIKPLVGPMCDGPSDASVVRPRLGSNRGIAVSNGINPRFGLIDPYWMAGSVIDEAIRQIVAVGGDLSTIAILDNFCWGNPDKPDRLGGLVRAAKGCHDFAVAYGTPFISGKDSFYNEYTDNGKSIAIPGTLLLSAMAIVKDVEKTVTMDFKRAGSLIYIIGNTYEEWGGSVYLKTMGALGTNVPKLKPEVALKAYKALASAIQKGAVLSTHDCSEGGLAVALAEMAFAGGFGATAILTAVPFEGKNKRDDMILFSESNSRLIVEVDVKKQKQFEALMAGVTMGMIGRVQPSPELFVYGLKDNLCLKADVNQLKEAWKKPLLF
ncbi:MAG: phosphoribosylformylglycinamidine synthase subunit PurL [Candidatus Omnitrophica bacterium]|nr:phosphoribosylformylglycinamidine synthase subunit PurL [Candidatus Omnitrophota bacterium]